MFPSDGTERTFLPITNGRVQMFDDDLFLSAIETEYRFVAQCIDIQFDKTVEAQYVANFAANMDGIGDQIIAFSFGKVNSGSAAIDGPLDGR